MRKLVVLFFLSVSLVAFGQKNKYSEVTFFGTDFSLVRVYGADNTAHQFMDAFYAINRLFISEPKKYDIQKALNIDVSAIDLKPVEKQNENIDLSQLLIDGYGGYVLTDQQIEQAVKNLSISSNEGTGLVIVAEVLNKASMQGSYKIVFFDISSRQILEVRNGKGKARGFGLRNFWAHSLLQAIKKAN